MSQQETKAVSTSAKKVSRPFQIVEAYKTLRTNLLFSLATAEHKSVVLCSPEPNAGKSTTAANLAIVMAQTNFKVLLIDADMRKPSLKRIFRVSATDGLSRLLCGMTTFEEAVSRNVAPGLDFLSSGPMPPNPQELLGSQRMRRLLQKAEKEYDYILIDTPPVNVVADALMLLPEVGGMLMLARQNSTTRDDLQAALEAVQRVDGRVLGLVMTDVRNKNVRNSAYYKANGYVYGK